MSLIRPQGALGVLRATGLAVVAAAALLAALAAAASHHGSGAYADTLVLAGNGTAGTPAQPATTSTAARGSFGISGSVAGLYPGAQLPLVLTVSNPEHFAIVVTSLLVTVGDAAPGCTAANLTVTSFSGQVQVPASGSAAVVLEVTMAHSATDACQGAVFPLHYTGLAGKAN
jgi:hypothetical protein